MSANRHTNKLKLQNYAYEVSDTGVFEHVNEQSNVWFQPFAYDNVSHAYYPIAGNGEYPFIEASDLDWRPYTIDGHQIVTSYDLISSISAAGSSYWINGNSDWSLVRKLGQFTGIADNEYSFSEGMLTVAEGLGAHAEGYRTQANSAYTHAEGCGTVADNEWSHSEGFYTLANGRASHSEGLMAVSLGDGSHAEGYSTTVQSTWKLKSVSGQPNKYTKSGTGTPLTGDILVYNGRYARINNISGTTITMSSTLGTISTASFVYIITGAAYGAYSHSEGFRSNAGGGDSHAEGSNTKALDYASHAEGEYTIASNEAAHAEGEYTTASGEAAHAEGADTTAEGTNSHAEGYDTYAEGNNSHAEGEITSSSGDTSHAEGYSTTTWGRSSHAEGIKTVTRNMGEHASGIANISHYSFNNDMSGSTIFSIGIGDYDDQTHTSVANNSFEVMRNGDMYINGIANYDGETIGDEKTMQHFLDITPLDYSEYNEIFGMTPMSEEDAHDLQLFIDRFSFDEDKKDAILEEFGYSSQVDFRYVIDDYKEYIEDGTYADYSFGSSWQWSGEDITIDDKEYYIFECTNNNVGLYALLSKGITLADLAKSIYNDINNRKCPFTAIVNEDTEILYDRLYNTTKDIDTDYALIYYRMI